MQIRGVSFKDIILSLDFVAFESLPPWTFRAVRGFCVDEGINSGIETDQVFPCPRGYQFIPAIYHASIAPHPVGK